MQRRDLMQQLYLACGFFRLSDLHLVDADQLLIIALPPVQRLEDLGNRQRMRAVRGQAFERSECRLVRRITLEHLTVALDGGLRLAHLTLAQGGQAQHQVALRVVRVGQAELSLQVVGQLGPQPAARE